MRRLGVVLLGIAIAAAIGGAGEARSRHHYHHRSRSGAPQRVEPEAPMDPSRWCSGGFPITDDQQIRGCTALISSRRDRDLRATAYYNRANAYFSKGDLSNAINDYGEALQIRPQYVEALNNRAVAYRASKNYAGAIADYSQVLMIAPHDVGALTGRGTAFGMKGNNERAIDDLSQAITIGTRDVTARLQRGHAYVRLQRWAEALTDYDQVLGTAPSNPEAYFGRACAKTYSGDLKGANADLTQAYLIDQGILETMVAQGIGSPIVVKPQDISNAPTFTRPKPKTEPPGDHDRDDTMPGDPRAPTNGDDRSGRSSGN